MFLIYDTWTGNWFHHQFEASDDADHYLQKLWHHDADAKTRVVVATVAPCEVPTAGVGWHIVPLEDGVFWHSGKPKAAGYQLTRNLPGLLGDDMLVHEVLGDLHAFVPREGVLEGVFLSLLEVTPHA